MPANNLPNANNIDSEKRSFADVVHQSLSFDCSEESSRLILDLLDTRWVQRLRRIRQTGNTHLVYMYAEHSRFGHSLGVAYLASLLMSQLESRHREQIREFRNAVAAAALLHDLGHTAPGSHLAEHIWNPDIKGQHEKISVRVVNEDPEIQTILSRYDRKLGSQVAAILSGSPEVPRWTRDIISGDGWNADRGNWSIVDSAMCCVHYGRYNVHALIDAFRLTDKEELVIQENRLDALTHFFVARDSMYRQVYQHRVLQSVDALTEKVALRLRDLIENEGTDNSRLFLDSSMAEVIAAKNRIHLLPLDDIYNMTDNWWYYHNERWCQSQDSVLSDLSSRLIDRRLLKTLRMPSKQTEKDLLLQQLNEVCQSLGFDPRYYLSTVSSSDLHRKKLESPPKVMLESGKIVPVTDVEPMIASILEKSSIPREWVVVPQAVKEHWAKMYI